MMYWDSTKYSYVWDSFKQYDINLLTLKYKGDQDFLNATLDFTNVEYFNKNFIKSWRWQIFDGGLNFQTREYLEPGKNALIDSETNVIIFHGAPKPHQITDPIILSNWA